MVTGIIRGENRFFGTFEDLRNNSLAAFSFRQQGIAAVVVRFAAVQF